jgi:hypothetical protein
VGETPGPDPTPRLRHPSPRQRGEGEGGEGGDVSGGRFCGSHSIASPLARGLRELSAFHVVLKQLLASRNDLLILSRHCARSSHRVGERDGNTAPTDYTGVTTIVEVHSQAEVAAVH